jgi:hypothetical protein
LVARVKQKQAEAKAVGKGGLSLVLWVSFPESENRKHIFNLSFGKPKHMTFTVIINHRYDSELLVVDAPSFHDAMISSARSFLRRQSLAWPHLKRPGAGPNVLAAGFGGSLPVPVTATFWPIFLLECGFVVQFLPQLYSLTRSPPPRLFLGLGRNAGGAII